MDLSKMRGRLRDMNPDALKEVGRRALSAQDALYDTSRGMFTGHRRRVQIAEASRNLRDLYAGVYEIRAEQARERRRS